MEIKKIITHASTFHADEVLALALLRVYGFSTPIERKFEIDENEFNDPLIFVLDVGKHYDPALGNFDHHQNADSPATNILIADWLTEQGLISTDVRENLSEFLNYVSDVDRGVIPGGAKCYTFNGIIRSINPASTDTEESNKAFETAVNLAQQIIELQIVVAEKAVKDKRKWQKLERICLAEIVINESLESLSGWDELAKAEGVKFMITPNARGGWQIISSDSTQFNIPVDSRQRFRHNSGFLAAYDTKQDAIDHASELAEK